VNRKAAPVLALVRRALRAGALGRAHWPISLALALLAAAVWLPPVTLERPTWNYMVTFDVTQSMNVEDMVVDGAPATRLVAARAGMREVLRRLPCGSKVGWSVFADYRVMPLLLPVEVCSHYEELLGALARIDGTMRWANASNVGKGVSWTLRTALAIGDDTRVVFFTDGHESPPLRPRESPPIHDLTPGEVGGWVIGVGADLPARIPRTDRDGNPAGFWAAADVVQRFEGGSGTEYEHLSELRESHLQGLAKMMGIGYLRLASPGSLDAALRDPALARAHPVATDVRWIPALLSLLLLAWRFLPDTVGLRRWLLRRRGARALRAG
jgi:mxaL protein